MPPIHLALDEAAFRTLVAGRIATVRAPSGQEVNIILSDIGWSRMLAAIDDADREQTSASGYQDDGYPERACDHCGKVYRGPAVYCSLGCALADA